MPYAAAKNHSVKRTHHLHTLSSTSLIGWSIWSKPTWGHTAPIEAAWLSFLVVRSRAMQDSQNG